MAKPFYPYAKIIAIDENEIDLYDASRLENIACKKAAEKMLSDNFDGLHLNGDCAYELCERFGMERVGWVLASTVQCNENDGRFRPHNSEWAKGFKLPNDSISDFAISSHPELVNGLIDQYRRYVQMMAVLNSCACIQGSLGGDYEDKLMIVRPNALKEEFRKSEYQYFYAQSGFGCSPHKIGGSVYGIYLADGSHGELRRGDFLGEADKFGLPDWAKQKLQELIILGSQDDGVEMGGMQ